MELVAFISTDSARLPDYCHLTNEVGSILVLLKPYKMHVVAVLPPVLQPHDFPLVDIFSLESFRKTCCEVAA